MRRYISDEPVRTETLRVRVFVEEKQALEAAARSAGKKTSAWVRDALKRAMDEAA